VRATRLSHVLPASLILAACSLGCARGADGVSATGLARVPNHIPMGVIEAPLDGATASGSLKIAGWAADDFGVRSIQVHVDGELVAIVGLSVQRPDVSTAYPHFRHGTDRHGWEASVERLSSGRHTIRVEAVDSNGAIADLGTRQVVVR
jgi:Bacterial Ig domain